MNRRRAKILATIGPSSNSVEMLEKLILAGMNGARVNMSHGTYEGHEQSIKNIREASKRTQKEVAILLDLQGPKIRVDKLPEPIELIEGQIWVIGPSHVKDQYPDVFSHHDQTPQAYPLLPPGTSSASDLSSS